MPGCPFFFSSRRRHTRLVSDWSSDVCSSDLCSSKTPQRIATTQNALGEHAGPDAQVLFSGPSILSTSAIRRWLEKTEWRREGSNAKELANARDWGLTPAAGGVSIPVDVKPTATGALEIDLSKTKASAGDYQLAATWDWDPLPV